MKKALTYSEYLKVDALLNLQQEMSPEHDELLFIVIHQVYELWFKVILQETSALNQHFKDNDLARAQAALKRIRSVLKTMVAQVDILETMTPLSFSAFRDRLDTASGFQSVQFREFEFHYGHRNPRHLAAHADGSPEQARLKALMTQPSVYDHLLAFLRRQGFAIPDTHRDYSQSVADNADAQEVLLSIYRGHPALAQLLENLVDIDEGVQEWRYRHVKMVERTIGIKIGTGGTGVDYLKATLFRPFFPDLWAIRSRM